MLNFYQLCDENLSEIIKYLPYQTYRTCDYSVGGLYMWRGYFSLRFSIVRDTLVFLANYPEKGDCFTFPVGGGDVDGAICDIIEYAKANGHHSRFCTVPKAGVEYFREKFTNERLIIEECRNWADYLYKATDFESFSGKKFHGQRNHLNKFTFSFPDSVFELLGADNLDQAQGFFAEFLKMAGESGDYTAPLAVEDLLRTQEVLDKFEMLKGQFCGGLLLSAEGGEVLGMTIGEIIGDTLYVHIEKATTKYPGTYQALSSAFAKYAVGLGVEYINREDDSGDEGLRKSKLAYNPVDILLKYNVEIL